MAPKRLVQDSAGVGIGTFPGDGGAAARFRGACVLENGREEKRRMVL